MSKENYQELSNRLEVILGKLQSPDVGVDEAVILYKEGLTLIAALEKHLQQAENTIEKLKSQAK